jgi:hypothetical protein
MILQRNKAERAAKTAAETAAPTAAEIDAPIVSETVPETAAETAPQSSPTQAPSRIRKVMLHVTERPAEGGNDSLPMDVDEAPEVSSNYCWFSSDQCLTFRRVLRAERSPRELPLSKSGGAHLRQHLVGLGGAKPSQSSAPMLPNKPQAGAALI